MKKYIIFLGILVLLALTVVNCDDEEDLGEEPSEKKGDVDESDVVVLTEKNFDETLSKNKFVLVEFYAPWCGHCKSLKAPYAAAAKEAKKLDPSVVLGKVDCTVEEAIAKKYNIEGFPTLKFAIDGEFVDYNGGRNKEDIVAWVKKRSGSPTKAISDVDEFNKFLEENNVVVAGFFAAKEGDLYTAFAKAALKVEKPFVEANAAIAEKHGVSVGSILLFKKFDEGKAEFKGEATAEAIQEFVSAQGKPSVFEFKEENVEEMFHNELPKLCIFASTEETTKAFSEAALDSSIRGKTILITVPKTADANFFEFVGVSADQATPLIVLIDATSGKKYRFEGPFTKDSIIEFTKSVAEGKIKPHLKSAPVPEKNEGPVIEVVGSTFKDIVLNPDKHVIIEFYAPWCGHCQQLAPIYDKVAAHFKSTNPDDIVIAKIDGTANEIAELDLKVEGFPTIYGFAKGAKDAPVDLSSKPRKNAKQMINTIAKVFNIASNRAGEDKYRDAVARLKVVLKEKPDLLQFVADELERVAKDAEAKITKPKEDL